MAVDAEVLLSLLPDRMDLPRGRAALSETEVAESRQGRILQAVIDEVAASGYHGTTIAKITKRAHISRTSFYEAFPDKEAAFAAAHLDASALALDLVWRPAFAGAEVDFATRAHTAVESYVRVIEGSPSFATCFFVEIRGAGRRLLDQRDAVMDRHVDILLEFMTHAAKVDDIGRAPDRDELVAMLGGFDELTARLVRAQSGRERLDLRSVVEPCTRILLSVARA